MKREGISVLLVVFVASALVPATFAGSWKGWRGNGGWGKGGSYQRMYDPTAVETLSGEVVKVEEFTAGKGMHKGIHMTVKNERETVSVHLGPAWYVERLDTQIDTGDAVEVTGSRITFQGQPAVIAEKVKKGDATLQLRDERGIPAWSGWRRSR